MKVLIGCEFTGRIRMAFRIMGHEAYSCDIRPAEHPSPYHIQDNLDYVINSNNWDLLIAHPPCTYLANSGVRWLIRDGVINEERFQLMLDGIRFFNRCFNANVPKVCIENPVMHSHAKKHGNIPEPSQLIKPWQFGHGEIKTTGLWLKGLPKLRPTAIVSGRWARSHEMSPGKNRHYERSKTYQGIADAMANQWGKFNPIK